MKSSGTENAATGLPRGTDANMGNSSILSPVLTADLTRSQIASGVVAEKMAVIQNATTPGRSSLLSADEAQRLARIARDRANRFMVAAPDVDFLLDVITRFQ